MSKMPSKCPTCGHQPLPDMRVVWREMVRRVIAGEKTFDATAPGVVTYTTKRTD